MPSENAMSPWKGSIPAKHLKRVLLPEPLSPLIQCAPGPRVRSSIFKINRSLKPLEKFRIWSMYQGLLTSTENVISDLMDEATEQYFSRARADALVNSSSFTSG